MDDVKEKILSQIRDEYGKLVYTYTSHNKEYNLISVKIKKLRFAKIVLSGISSLGFVSTVFSNSKVVSVLGSIVSVALFVITMLLNEETMANSLSSHKNTLDQLWIIREEYISLISEFESLTVEDIKIRRDKLLLNTSEVYKNALPTTAKAYKQSQKALKKDEEQFFEDSEIDLMLPKALRKTKK